MQLEARIAPDPHAPHLPILFAAGRSPVDWSDGASHMQPTYISRRRKDRLCDGLYVPDIWIHYPQDSLVDGCSFLLLVCPYSILLGDGT